jgi:hypothetical protein
VKLPDMIRDCNWSGGKVRCQASESEKVANLVNNESLKSTLPDSVEKTILRTNLRVTSEGREKASNNIQGHHERCA